MNLKMDYNNMMNDFIGEKGISINDIENIKDKIEKAKLNMVQKRKRERKEGTEGRQTIKGLDNSRKR